MMRPLQIHRLSLILCCLLTATTAGPASITFESEVHVIPFKHREVLDLPGEQSCHTQGITITAGKLFVSCVDRPGKRALVYHYDLDPGFPEVQGPLSAPRKVDITRGALYHPSGLDHDGRCVWVAVAHYRQFRARSEMLCLDPVKLQVLESFPVADHIGAVAVMGDKLVGMNWDSADIYIFDQQGKQIYKQANPVGTGYQDCRGFSEQTVLCSGPFTESGRKMARIDLLTYQEGAGIKLEGSFGVFDPSVTMGREGFTADFSQGKWWFAPKDFPGAQLYRYDGFFITP